MKRKQVWSLVVMLLLASTSLAQTELPPKEEYRVTASANSITLTKGQRDSVKVSIIRSKSFKSGKALLSTHPPSDVGVTMSMKQYPERPDEFHCVSLSIDRC